MAKTTIAVPEGHHVEVHAPGAPPSGSYAPPPGPATPGMIPDATATGMQGAMDQALATAPKPKAAPKPAPKGEQKPAKKPAKKKKAKSEAGDKKALGEASSAVNSAPDDGDE